MVACCFQVENHETGRADRHLRMDADQRPRCLGWQDVDLEFIDEVLVHEMHLGTIVDQSLEESVNWRAE